MHLQIPKKKKSKLKMLQRAKNVLKSVMDLNAKKTKFTLIAITVLNLLLVETKKSSVKSAYYAVLFTVICISHPVKKMEPS